MASAHHHNLLEPGTGATRSSEPFLWPGAEAELAARGLSGSAAVTVKYLPLSTFPEKPTIAEIAESANYLTHGATLSVASPLNRCWIGPGYIYVEVADGSTEDEYSIGISRVFT